MIMMRIPSVTTYVIVSFCLLSTLGIESVTAHPIVGIVIRADGSVVIVDGDLAKREFQLWSISPDGSKQMLCRLPRTKDGAAGPIDPHGLALDAEGNIYLPSYDGTVWKFTREEALVRHYPPPGEDRAPSPSFSFGGSGIVVSPNGDLFVLDSSTKAGAIYRITADGGIVRIAPEAQLGSLYGSGLARDREGVLYLIDRQRIVKVHLDGTVVVMAGTGDSGYRDGPGSVALFESPQGIAVDPHGNVYVAEVRANRIRRITPDGEVTTFAGSGRSASIDGKGTEASFRFPSGVAVDRAGNLYVLANCLAVRRDTKSAPSIRIISAEGVVTTYGASTKLLKKGSAKGVGAVQDNGAPRPMAQRAMNGWYLCGAVLISASLFLIFLRRKARHG